MDIVKKIYKETKSFILETYKIIQSIFSMIGIDYSFMRYALIFFSIRFFLIDYSLIPSCSMTPTARTGDIVLLNKSAYGISTQNIHIPYWIFPQFYMMSKSKINIFYILNKIFPNIEFFNIQPKRGDLCTFVLDRNPKIIYFKRIVAIGGDRVQMKDGILYINGVPVKMELIGDIEFVDDKYSFIKKIGTKYKITLSNGLSYEILRDCEIGAHSHDNTMEYKVPMGYVWVQGDFNTGSSDSFEIDFTEGAIPVKNLLGRPFFTISSSNARDEKEATSLEWWITVPIRIIRYIYNLDYSRILKRLK